MMTKIELEAAARTAGCTPTQYAKRQRLSVQRPITAPDPNGPGGYWTESFAEVAKAEGGTEGQLLKSIGANKGRVVMTDGELFALGLERS